MCPNQFKCIIDASNATKCVRDALKNVSIKNEIIKINTPFLVTCEVIIYYLLLLMFKNLKIIIHGF